MSAAVAAAEDVAARLAAVQRRIAGAAERAGRDPSEVTLVAVSKTFPADHVRLALDAGVQDLGENRVQEAEEKVPLLPAGVRWHLIGHLQKNKINKALELFSLLHGVDTVQLAEGIANRAARQGKPAAVLLQVNLAEKESQFGLGEDDVAAAVRKVAGLDGLSLDGLMCIAPEVDDSQQARPFFQRLAALHHSLAPAMRDAGHPWRHLSMGMTNDFEVAIEEGATLVRVGRAIFGERVAAHH